MKFKDIQQFPFARYQTDYEWESLPRVINKFNKENGFDFDPPYQRGYVWTIEQQIAFIEYGLRGGMSGKDIYLNCKGWQKDWEGIIEVVDGKQRLKAVLDFLDNKFKVFGGFYKDYTDKIRFTTHFTFHINNLQTQKEVVEWYLGMNTGGTYHTEDDLLIAKKYLAKLEA